MLKLNEAVINHFNKKDSDSLVSEKYGNILPTFVANVTRHMLEHLDIESLEWTSAWPEGDILWRKLELFMDISLSRIDSTSNQSPKNTRYIFDWAFALCNRHYQYESEISNIDYADNIFTVYAEHREDINKAIEKAVSGGMMDHIVNLEVSHGSSTGSITFKLTIEFGVLNDEYNKEHNCSFINEKCNHDCWGCPSGPDM